MSTQGANRRGKKKNTRTTHEERGRSKKREMKENRSKSGKKKDRERNKKGTEHTKNRKKKKRWTLKEGWGEVGQTNSSGSSDWLRLKDTVRLILAGRDRGLSRKCCTKKDLPVPALPASTAMTGGNVPPMEGVPPDLLLAIMEPRRDTRCKSLPSVSISESRPTV